MPAPGQKKILKINLHVLLTHTVIPVIILAIIYLLFIPTHLCVCIKRECLLCAGTLLRSCIYQRAKQQSSPSWSLHLAWSYQNEQIEKQANCIMS